MAGPARAVYDMVLCRFCVSSFKQNGDIAVLEDADHQSTAML